MDACLIEARNLARTSVGGMHVISALGVESI